LIQQGIPAVIAMQFAVSDQAAIGLAASFYAALADGYPVDAALTEARKSLFTHDSGAEWGTPVLYLRAADGRIFDLQASPAMPTETLPPAAPARTAPRWTRPRLLWMGAGVGVALVMVLALIFAWRGGGGTALPAQPTPVATVLFPFAPTDAPWQGDPAQWKIVPVGSGSYAYQGSATDTDTVSAPPNTDLFLGWSDYELALQVRVVQAGLSDDDLPDLWLTVRHDPGKTTGCGGYNLSLDGYWRKAVISPISNGGCPWVALAETPIGLDVGDWHDLRVRAEGDHLQMWLDEQLVGDAHDGRSTSGFFFLNVGAGAVVQFRQVQASRLR
jgi:hypothetical protein